MFMKRSIALVAHDNRKEDLLQWVKWNLKKLSKHKIVCTGTTGKLIEKLFKEEDIDKKPKIIKLNSGPLGGDFQLGSRIVENDVDMVIFLWDPMEAQPHDVDVKALLRICVLENIPLACNRASADYLISSKLMEDKTYEPIKKDYSNYSNRKL